MTALRATPRSCTYARSGREERLHEYASVPGPNRRWIPEAHALASAHRIGGGRPLGSGPSFRSLASSRVSSSSSASTRSASSFSPRSSSAFLPACSAVDDVLAEIQKEEVA
jgi:hypothetical protein